MRLTMYFLFCAVTLVSISAGARMAASNSIVELWTSNGEIGSLKRHDSESKLGLTEIIDEKPTKDDQSELCLRGAHDALEILNRRHESDLKSLEGIKIYVKQQVSGNITKTFLSATYTDAIEIDYKKPQHYCRDMTITLFEEGKRLEKQLEARESENERPSRRLSPSPLLRAATR